MRVDPDCEEEEQGYFPFEILAVSEPQALPTVFSVPAPEGEWTVLDCRALEDSTATFTIAIRNTDEAVAISAQAALMVADRRIGSNLLGLIAAAFRTELPRVRQPQTPLEPLMTFTVNFGGGLVRDPEGGFSIDVACAGSAPPGEPIPDPTADIDPRSEGGWMATKWTLERDGHHAHLFVNYNLRQGRGEFLEKDPADREELLAVLASALRDGPRPERTPETDSNLTWAGPRVADVWPILDRWDRFWGDQFAFAFTPGGAYLVYRWETSLYAVDPSKPGERIELARFDGAPESVSIVDDAPNLVVLESILTKREGFNLAGRGRLWWIDATTGEKTRLRGPEWYLGLGEFSVSPDGRYVAIEKWRSEARRRRRRRTVDLLDRESEASQLVEVRDFDLTCVGWTLTAAGLWARLLGRRRETSGDRGPSVYLADPASGSVIEAQQIASVSNGLALVSADGRRTAEIRDGTTLALADIMTGQSGEFTFHEDDRPYVSDHNLRWASPRYLQFQGRRLALIDAMTLKMNFPGRGSAADVPMIRTRFSRDLAWIAYQADGHGDGLFLGRMTLARIDQPPDYAALAGL